MSKGKIFHGVREIAGQAYYSIKGLRDNGEDAELVLWDESKFKYPHDYCLYIDKERKKMYPIYALKIIATFFRALLRFKVYHFHFGYSLLPFNLDLPILKLFGKKVFFEFHGYDCRQKSIAVQFNPLWENQECGDESWLKKRLKKISKYADGIIIHDDELLPHIEPFASPFIVPLRMDVQNIKPVNNTGDSDKDVVTIVHAPSNSAIKGTKYVNAAIERLSKEHDIRYILVQGMSQQEAFEQYKKADIIVDQLVVGTYGVFAIEAMAMGKVVVTYITDEMKGRLPEELPIVSASTDNIEQVLDSLIANKNERDRRAAAGIDYARNYHDCRNNAKVLIDIYAGSVSKCSGRDAFTRVKEKSNS